MSTDLELIPHKWLQWEPPSSCHDFGIGALGTVLSLGGTLLSAQAASAQGDYANKVAEAQAAELRNKANEDAAAAQRQQISDLRKTDLALSRARAVAAASGTEATSPDVLTTEGQIAQQGTYNALASLYEGQAKARSDIYQADIDLWKGAEAKRGASPAAFGTILSGLSNALTTRAQRGYATQTGKSPFLTGF